MRRLTVLDTLATGRRRGAAIGISRRARASTDGELLSERLAHRRSIDLALVERSEQLVALARLTADIPEERKHVIAVLEAASADVRAGDSLT
jgi:hypothetical protein